MSNDTFSARHTYPKGLKGIIANESALSDVRGEEGRLLYLGYDIDDLVEMCCFEEVIYLLLNKRLPNLLDWLGAAQPDVVCLQELKADDHAFPEAALARLRENRRIEASAQSL